VRYRATAFLLVGAWASAVICAVVGSTVSDVFGLVLALAFGVFSLFLALDAGVHGGFEFVILFIVSAIGTAAIVTCPIPLVGTRSGAISVMEAPSYEYSNIFHLKDARVAIEHEQTIDIVSGRRGVRETRYFVAPLVWDGWTPAIEVPVWVVRRRNASHDACSTAWSVRAQGGVRLATGRIVSDLEEVVDRAKQGSALRSHKDAPVLNWCDSPSAALSDARHRVFLIGAVGSVLIALTFLANSILSRFKPRK
jgi:hypothetical protein